MLHIFLLIYAPFIQESKDEQWKRAMDYLNVVNELNYMTQIVIMLYEDPNKVTKFLIFVLLGQDK